MSNQKVVYNGGVSFLGLLTIAFIVLKLLEIIDWSWWLVLLPTLIPIGLIVFCIVCWIILICLK